MSGFFSSSKPSSTPGPSLQSKDDIIQALQQDMAKRKLAELVNMMQTQCFKRCVTQPSASLSTSESACISQCVQKYLGTLDVVSKQWNKSVSEMGGASSRTGW